jgi:hypothetical protein
VTGTPSLRAERGDVSVYGCVASKGQVDEQACVLAQNTCAATASHNSCAGVHVPTPCVARTRYTVSARNKAQAGYACQGMCVSEWMSDTPCDAGA